MEKNVGDIDRRLRLVIGTLLVAGAIVILAGYWALGPLVGVVALVVGGTFLVTGATRTCPVNAAVGIDTSE